MKSILIATLCLFFSLNASASGSIFSSVVHKYNCPHFEQQPTDQPPALSYQVSLYENYFGKICYFVVKKADGSTSSGFYSLDTVAFDMQPGEMRCNDTDDGIELRFSADTNQQPDLTNPTLHEFLGQSSDCSPVR